MSTFRRWGLTALVFCLPAATLPSAAGAPEDVPPAPDKAVDVAVHKALRNVINEGADMYNAQGKYQNQDRDYAGCYHLYQGALIAVRPLLASRPELQKAIDDGLDNAEATPEVARRAFVLRAVIDQIRDATSPNPKTAVAPPTTGPNEIKFEGKVTRVDQRKLTVKPADGSAKEFVVPADAGVTIDGKAGKVEDVKPDFTVSILEKDGVVAKVDAKASAAPPPPAEKTTPGKAVGVEKDRLTFTADGKDQTVTVPADAKVLIDGKDGKLDEIKKDALVTVTARGDVVTKVDVRNPPPPAPPEETVSGKFVGAEKEKLTASVDGKERTFTVTGTAKILIDGKEGKLEDLKKDSTLTITAKAGVVSEVDAKSPAAPPPAPKVTTVLGKVVGVDKDKLTVSVDEKEKVFTVPADAKITIDDKDGKLADIKKDSTVTVVSNGDAVASIDVKSPLSPPPPPPPPGTQTLWDRLGGEKGVAKVVDDFVSAAGTDPKVNFWRDPTFTPTKDQVAALKKGLVAWVSSKTGGPLKYEGKDMKEVHKGMKITDAEFDACAADFKAALEKDAADLTPSDEIAVMNAVEATRKDLVEAKAPEDKPKPPDEKKPDDKPAETGTVSGKVTYNGQPLAAGKLTFTSADGKTTATADIKDGSYRLEQLNVGSYKVTVQTDPTKPSPIPAKFQKAETTSIMAEVRKGDSTYDIDLKD